MQAKKLQIIVEQRRDLLKLLQMSESNSDDQAPTTSSSQEFENYAPAQQSNQEKWFAPKTIQSQVFLFKGRTDSLENMDASQEIKKQSLDDIQIESRQQSLFSEIMNQYPSKTTTDIPLKEISRNEKKGGKRRKCFKFSVIPLKQNDGDHMISSNSRSEKIRNQALQSELEKNCTNQYHVNSNLKMLSDKVAYYNKNKLLNDSRVTNLIQSAKKSKSDKAKVTRPASQNKGIKKDSSNSDNNKEFKITNLSSTDKNCEQQQYIDENQENINQQNIVIRSKIINEQQEKDEQQLDLGSKQQKTTYDTNIKSNQIFSNLQNKQISNQEKNKKKQKSKGISFNEDVIVYEVSNWKKYNSNQYLFGDNSDISQKKSICSIF